MPTETIKYGQVRQLTTEDEIPFDLLLLADESRDAIELYIRDSQIFLLENDHDVIAVFVMQEVSNMSVEIKNIAVTESYQGKGIGKFLLNDAAIRARDMGYDNLMIGTANGSIMQLYLYQKEGFEIVGIRKDFFTDNYPKPIYENGIHCKHMIVLQKKL